VTDIADSFRAGKKEIKLTILPEAEALGLTQLDLARQVRQAFYGEEAQRIQRGRDDVRVMVRYPAAERRALGDLGRRSQGDHRQRRARVRIALALVRDRAVRGDRAGRARIGGAALPPDLPHLGDDVPRSRAADLRAARKPLFPRGSSLDFEVGKRSEGGEVRSPIPGCSRDPLRAPNAATLAPAEPPTI
jgi:hypothetical protein